MDDNLASKHLPGHVSRYSSFNLKSHTHTTFTITFSEFLIDNEDSDYRNVWTFQFYVT